jgi:hypothetical protein
MKVLWFTGALCCLAMAPLLAAPIETRQTFVGIWQASPSMAAGWNQTYRFFANGRFVYHASQMDCATRDIERRGNWHWQSGKIALKMTHQVWLQGGKFQPSTGSCGTAQELVGARRVLRKHARPSRVSLAYGPVRLDAQNNRLTTQWGGIRFWKFENDARRYP